MGLFGKTWEESENEEGAQAGAEEGGFGHDWAQEIARPLRSEEYNNAFEAAREQREENEKNKQ